MFRDPNVKYKILKVIVVAVFVCWVALLIGAIMGYM